MKAFRLALARVMFKAGLPALGGLMLPERGVLLLDDGTLVFQNTSRIETRKGMRIE